MIRVLNYRISHSLWICVTSWTFFTVKSAHDCSHCLVRSGCTIYMYVSWSWWSCWRYPSVLILSCYSCNDGFRGPSCSEETFDCNPLLDPFCSQAQVNTPLAQSPGFITLYVILALVSLAAIIGIVWYKRWVFRSNLVLLILVHSHASIKSFSFSLNHVPNVAPFALWEPTILMHDLHCTPLDTLSCWQCSAVAVVSFGIDSLMTVPVYTLLPWYRCCRKRSMRYRTMARAYKDTSAMVLDNPSYQPVRTRSSSTDDVSDDLDLCSSSAPAH